MEHSLLHGFPTKAPSASTTGLLYADVAVTATAKEFAGFYRGKQYHDTDIDAILDRALAAHVQKVMLTGMYLEDVLFNLDIARRRRDQCSITVGVHPYHANEADEGGESYYEALARMINDTIKENPKSIVAFGELGLDYDYLKRADKDIQKSVFQRQLQMIVAEGWDLPLFLHCRAAFEDFVAILKPYLDRLPRRGLVHSFVGTSGQMQVLVDMGFDISVNGFSFRDRDSLEMVRDVPLEKLQLETDAPWGEIPASSEVAKVYLKKAKPLPAAKKRDKFEMGKMVKERNESCAIERVAMIVAGLKEISVEEVAGHAWENSTRMFRL